MSDAKGGPTVALDHGGETVRVPWHVGATVDAEPRLPVRKTDRRADKAAMVEAQLAERELALKALTAAGNLGDSIREELERRVELDRKRSAWMRGAATAKRADLRAREAALVADLGADVEFLVLGLPSDRRADMRLLEGLSELALVRFALGEAEE